MARVCVQYLLLIAMILLATSASAVESDAAFPGTPTWVFFVDKGVGIGDLAQALDERRANLSARAMQRRERTRPGEAVDEADLDVNVAYIDAVLDTGVLHRATSRWLNAVSVEADAAQLQAIEALPFVASTRPVAASRRSPDSAPPPPPGPAPRLAMSQLVHSLLTAGNW